MIYRLLLTSLMIFSLLDCQNQNAANSENSKENSNSSTDQKNIIYLKEGENKFLKDYKMNVTFKKMIEDSRCPKEVQCIWAGNATAEIELMGIYTRPSIINLSTTNDVKKGWATMQEFNGYSISLIEVSPETTSAKGFKSLLGNYRIALKLEKILK